MNKMLFLNKIITKKEQKLYSKMLKCSGQFTKHTYRSSADKPNISNVPKSE
jgi:hypothetical protein